MTTFLLVMMAGLMLGVMFALGRLILGPSLADRVVALDVIAALAVGSASLYAVITGVMVLLDIAVVLALVSFVATVGFARYLERKAVES